MPDIKILKKQLLKWFKKNQRQGFIWRHTADPYRILIAEILLQRTRAEQVLPVYRKFLVAFPGTAELAEAGEKRIMEVIRPLGLAWRGKMLKGTAEDIMEKHNGQIPPDRKQLLGIRGIGEYVADSILYQAFGVRTSIIDSNIVRIIGRIHGMETDSESRRNRRFRAIADEMLPRKDFRNFNLALIDLGALICIRKPKCSICPIGSECQYCHNAGAARQNEVH